MIDHDTNEGKARSLIEKISSATKTRDVLLAAKEEEKEAKEIDKIKNALKLAFGDLMEQNVETEGANKGENGAAASVKYSDAVPKDKDEFHPRDPEPYAELMPKEKTGFNKSRQSRTRQINARFTEQEYEHVQNRIARTGLSQGDYVRKMLLQGRVSVRHSSYYEEELLAETTELLARVGSIGGLLLQLRAQGICDADALNNILVEVQNMKLKVSKMERRMHEYQAHSGT